MELTPYQRKRLVPYGMFVLLIVGVPAFMIGATFRDNLFDFHGPQYSIIASFLYFTLSLGIYLWIMKIASWMVYSWTKAELYTKKICYQCGYDVRHNKAECPECGLKWNKE